MKTLTGKVAMITGAAGGIGQALSRRLAREGMHLALVDLEPDALFASLEALPDDAVASVHCLDLVCEQERLVDEVLLQHEAVHLLIHNAGCTVFGELADQTAAEVDRVLDVNLRVPFQLTRRLLPQMRAAGEGHLVFMSSMAALMGLPAQSTYSASKAGLRSLSESLRIELHGTGIGVSAILPGPVRTRLLARAASREPELTARIQSLIETWGVEPDAIAAVVVDAVRRNRAEVRPGWLAKGLSALRRTSSRVPRGVLSWLQASRER